MEITGIAGTPLRFGTADEAPSMADALAFASAGKRWDPVAQKVTTQFDAELSSPSLGGRITVRTLSPIETAYGAWPELPSAGSIAVAGEGVAVLRIAALPGNLRDLLHLQWDAEGDGYTDSVRVATWRSLSTGLLFAREPGGDGAPGYGVEEGFIFPTFPTPLVDEVVPSAALVFQFETLPSNPPAAIELLRTGRTDSQTWGNEILATTIERQGTTWTVRPISQLEPGQIYTPRFLDTRGAEIDAATLPALRKFTLNGGIIVEGSSEPFVYFVAAADAYWTVRETVSATIDAPEDPLLTDARTVVLNGSGSTAEGGAPRFSWQQVGGPPLTFATATVASPSLELTQPGGTAGTAIVELIVRNPAGEFDKANVKLFVMPPDAPGPLFYVVSNEPGDPVDERTTRLLSHWDGEIAARPYPKTRWFDGGVLVHYEGEAGQWSLEIAAAPGEDRLAVANEGQRIYYTGRPGAEYASCAAERAELRDVAYATDGSLARLAADFGCDELALASLRGSVRINAPIAVPR